MSEVIVTGAEVRYGRTVAVHDATLRVASGGALGIVGESGSGKTTLARAIIGDLPITAGEVRIGGEVGLRHPRARRRVQLVPQDPYSSLNPRMTVAQTIGELLRVHRLCPREKRRERIAQLLDTVRLDPDSMHGYPHEFSGGERQRIALARALAVEPDVLVADEPTSALDVSVQQTIIALLRRLRSDLGLTLLFISHDLGVVHELCDEVVVMRRGVIVEHGSAGFFEAPAHPYSRRLLESVPRLPHG